MDPDLFPVVPEDIGSLTDEALDELIAGHEKAIVRIATGEAYADMETPPDRNARRDTLKAGKDALLALRAAKAERVTEETEFAAEVAEIVAEAGVEMNAEASAEDDAAEASAEASDDAAAADDEDEPAADDEGATADEAEEGAGASAEASVEDGEAKASVTAGAGVGQPKVYRHRPPATAKRNQPVASGQDGPVLVASAGLERIGEGQPLDRDGLAEATLEKLRRFVATPKGFSEKVVVASASWADQYPDERKLEGRNMAVDQSKIDAVRSRQALLAAGGWCAPSTIRYDVGTLGTQERPVRDALTPFNATRGGLQYLPDFSIVGTDTTPGISRFTEAEDAAGGSLYIKECVTIECPDFSDVRADIISTCLQAGNLMSMAFPELVAAWQDLLGVAAARNRDSGLLDGIRADAQTKEVSLAKNTAFGALSQLVTGLVRVGAGYRSRHRLSSDAVLRGLAPAWLADLLVLDMVNSQFERFGLTRAGAANLIQTLTGVNLEWYIDSSSTGTDQIFGAQAEGAIDSFPADAEVYLYPEGGILYIDQGELNIGLVRDSVLNETNDVRFFAEVFENVAVLANEVFVITFEDICPDGTTSGPITVPAAVCTDAA